MSRCGADVVIGKYRGAAVNCQLSGVPFIRQIRAATGIVDEVLSSGIGLGNLGIGGGPIAVDQGGNVYMSDYFRYVYKIDGKTGLITVIAGTGEAGGSGDGGPATAAQLDTPGALAMDSLGGLYVAVTGNTGIRKIDLASGAISTVTSTADLPAEFQARQRAGALAIDADGNLFLSVSDLLFGYYRTGSILKISTDHEVSLYAGDGFSAGEDILAVGSWIHPTSMTFDADGFLYFLDGVNVLRRIDPLTQTISTVAGNTTALGPSGDGGPALAARFDSAASLASDGRNIFVGDGIVIRRIYAAPAPAANEKR